MGRTYLTTARAIPRAPNCPRGTRQQSADSSWEARRSHPRGHPQRGGTARWQAVTAAWGPWCCAPEHIQQAGGAVIHGQRFYGRDVKEQQ